MLVELLPLAVSGVLYDDLLLESAEHFAPRFHFPLIDASSPVLLI
jgi:hypothetical protein